MLRPNQESTDHLCRGKGRSVSPGVPEEWIANQVRVDRAHTEERPRIDGEGLTRIPAFGRMPRPRHCGPMGHPWMIAAPPHVLHPFHYQPAGLPSRWFREASSSSIPTPRPRLQTEIRRCCAPDLNPTGGSAAYIGVPLVQLPVACFVGKSTGTGRKSALPRSSPALLLISRMQPASRIAGPLYREHRFCLSGPAPRIETVKPRHHSPCRACWSRPCPSA